MFSRYLPKWRNFAKSGHLAGDLARSEKKKTKPELMQDVFTLLVYCDDHFSIWCIWLRNSILYQASPERQNVWNFFRRNWWISIRIRFDMIYMGALVQWLRVTTHVREVMGLNPCAVYWMEIFSHWFVVKIILFVWKEKRGRGLDVWIGDSNYYNNCTLDKWSKIIQSHESKSRN